MASNFSILLLAFLTVSSLSIISIVHGDGFSVDLIHRDSPLSPFYNPLEKPFDRVQNAIHRSVNRVNHFKKASDSSVSTAEAGTIVSTVVSNRGEYLMKFSLGTPGHEVLAIADTGSDLIWTQCKPCDGCYKQIAPLFDPNNSSTYKDLSCSSRICEALGSVSCDEHDACSYNVRYGDQSYSYGNVAVETFTFDSTSGRSVKLPKIAFGCGHKNAGTFDKGGSGLVGLGGGAISLISQLGSKIDSKFSYCLVALDSKSKTKASKLNFGSHAEISGEGVVSTPLVQKSDLTFYYLTLEGLSVGEHRIAFKSSSKTVNGVSSSTAEEGNIIIDSGTTLTLLPVDVYDELESEVKKAIDLEPTTPPQNLNLCYSVTDDQDISKIIPNITAHFTDADVVLQPRNTFILVDEGVICLGFVPSDQGVSIFGNIAQMNFIVEYDIENKKVSFKPTDCSKEEEE